MHEKPIENEEDDPEASTEVYAMDAFIQASMPLTDTQFLAAIFLIGEARGNPSPKGSEKEIVELMAKYLSTVAEQQVIGVALN